MAQMQHTLGSLPPETTSGTDLATSLVSFEDALLSLHRGPTRPSYALGGTLWLHEVDNSSTLELILFDGAQDIVIQTIDTTANVAQEPRFSGALISNSNLDAIRDTGIFEFPSSASNKPHPSGGGVLWVMSAGAEDTQIATQSAGLYTRRWTGSGWSDWVLANSGYRIVVSTSAIPSSVSTGVPTLFIRVGDS